MNKILKLLAILFGSIVAVVIAAAIALPLLFDPNDFKQEITQLVKDETGRELVIQDDIKLSVFPWLGVELGSVQLSNAKGFGKAPFATVKQAGVRVKLLPLLRKEVEMDTVTLDGLQLNLIKSKSGRTNWDDLMAPGAASATKPQDEGGVGIAALAIGGLDIRDSQLRWTDHSAKTAYTLGDLSMRTGALSTGLPVDLAIGFNISSKQPEIQGQVKLNGTITLDVATQNYHFNKLKLTTDLKGKGIPGGRLNSTLSADITTDLASQVMKLTGLTLELPGMKLSGNITGKQILNKPRFSGTIKTSSFSPRTLLEAMNGEQLNTADPKAMGKASLETKLSATTSSIKLTGLRATLDDTTLSGSVSVNNFTRPATKFDLKLDAIDLDRYLPPVTHQQAYSNTQPEDVMQYLLVAIINPVFAAAPLEDLIPVKTFRTLNTSGKLHIGSMKASNVHSKNISLSLNSKKGITRLYPVSASMYGGTYKGNIQLDVNGRQPRFSINESIRNIQVGALLKDFTGTKQLSGQGNITVKVTAAGNDFETLKRSMNGNASFNIKNGVVYKINVLKDTIRDFVKFRNIYEMFQGDPALTMDESNDTEFTSLTGTLNLVNGIGNNNDLFLGAKEFTLSGKGVLDFIRSRLIHKGQLVFAKDLKLAGLKENENRSLRGLSIPYEINCPFNEISGPCMKRNVQKVFQDIAKKKLKKKLLKQLGIPTEPQQPAPAQQPAPQQQPQQAPAPVDEKKELKKKLKRKLLEGLFK